jgi:hypothetical protein
MVGLRFSSCAAALAVAAPLFLAACDSDGIRVRGFVLPEGDPLRGEAAFVALGCPSCHTVAGTDLTEATGGEYSVLLGGKVLQVRHYGDLLTSIVHPDHRVRLPYATVPVGEDRARSPMPDLTETMSVAQLVDVVAFLHGKYEKLPNYGGKYYYYP